MYVFYFHRKTRYRLETMPGYLDYIKFIKSSINNSYIISIYFFLLLSFCFGEADQDFEEVSVQVEFEGAALEFGQVFGY